MDKNNNKFSKQLSRFRGWIQAAATLLTNIHLTNFIKGGIYQGKGKTVCVPGLNCYSSPRAVGEAQQAYRSGYCKQQVN